MTEPTRDDRSRTVYLSVLASVLASVATTYGLRALEGPETHEVVATTVEVPDIVGLELDVARELASSRGLRIVVGGEDHSAEHEAGAVMRQDPLAGSEVVADTALQVVTSLGPPAIPLPDLTGQTPAQVTARLTSLGLVLGAQTEGGEGEAGMVNATDPPAGAPLHAGDAVAITVTPAGLMVPEVVGTSYRAAREALEALGLTVRVRRRYDEGRPDMVVTASDPEVGTVIEPASTVTITIND